MVVYFENRLKTKHIANIFGVYVDNEYRGEGVGVRLLERALREISKNKAIVKIKLQVNPMQRSAVRLYEKSGFRPIGIMKKELYINGKYFDELCMEKLLS